MTLIKWKPQNKTYMDNINEILNFRYNDKWGFSSSSDYEWSPPVDILESKNEYNIIVDIPGLSKKDIKLNVIDNFLIIFGERSNEIISNNEFYNYTERYTGSFKRKFNLNDLIDEEKIAANFKDGLLKIKLPKIEKTISKEKNIKIN